MFSGSINEVPQRIKQVPRRIREVPRRLTIACGRFNGLPGDQRWCRDTNDGCRHAAGHAVGGVSGWWLVVRPDEAGSAMLLLITLILISASPRSLGTGHIRRSRHRHLHGARSERVERPDVDR